MKNLSRAQRKKAVKQFKPGDVVTWGTGATWHRVVEVTKRGVIVDVTEADNVGYFGVLQPDGRYFLLVLYDANIQGNTLRCRFREYGVSRGPVRHQTDKVR